VLYFPKWLVTLILAICLGGVVLSIPNMFQATTVETWPNWLPKKQVSLGLDLQGGVYLLYEVKMRSVLTERLNGLVDDLRTELRGAKPSPIGYTGLGVDGDRAVVTLRDPSQIDEVRGIIRRVNADFDITVGDGGAISLKYNDIKWQQLEQQIVEQSIEIVRRRVDESGTKEATVQREGDDRIVLELPGLRNPDEVERLLGQTAKMTFQLVDENANPGDRAHVPPGDEILPRADTHSEAGTPIVVQKRVMVSGENLTDAHVTFQQGAPVVAFRFDQVGARRFGDVTSKNIGHLFAIVLDGKVISAPVIRSAITGGQGVIEGGFTTESANELALLLRAGALPAPLVPLEKRTVGPDLGADSIHAGPLATTAGVILVVVFMVVFYGLFGLFADVALFFNLCLMLASLTLLGATLTLPGIAGIALTLGMAVDANVLIYERIREELRGGRSLISSLQAGFERAFGTIFDSHLTTLVAGFLMFFLGSGPVKGFAVTLSIGVITSLFSAILVTRLQIVGWLRQTKPKTIPI
ncbi:MAG TPA: protein translocase subunit SecD, partial [Stellaceae bacterium]|nr:protein translocase subunit SecD [Stellaceae bacterium]